MHSNQDILNVIIDAIQDKKGSGITVVDLEAIESAPTSKFVICQGRSTSQVLQLRIAYERKSKNPSGVNHIIMMVIEIHNGSS